MRSVQDDFFPVFAEWARNKGLDQAKRQFATVLKDSLAEYVTEYERRMAAIETDDPPLLHGPAESWYPGPIDEDTYWPRLRQHLVDKLGWTDARIHPVDQASTKVVAYTPAAHEADLGVEGPGPGLRAEREDDELHLGDRQGRRRRIQAGDRPVRDPQRAAPPDPGTA
jgi:hypothetical protein